MINYFPHVLVAVQKVLKNNFFAKVSSPDEVERKSMHCLVTGFPTYVGFVDGTKLRRRKPNDKVEQELKYDVQRKLRSSVAFIWVDVFGLINHVDFF